MQEPLVRRREMLADVCEKLDVPKVQFSHAVIGAGIALYQTALASSQEGVMAKRLSSMYWPGKRSVSLKKIKPPTRRKRLQRDIFSR